MMEVPPPAPAVPPRGVPYGSQPDLLPLLRERITESARHDNACSEAKKATNHVITRKPEVAYGAVPPRLRDARIATASAGLCR